MILVVKPIRYATVRNLFNRAVRLYTKEAYAMGFKPSEALNSPSPPIFGRNLPTELIAAERGEYVARIMRIGLARLQYAIDERTSIIYADKQIVELRNHLGFLIASVDLDQNIVVICSPGMWVRDARHHQMIPTERFQSLRINRHRKLLKRNVVGRRY